MTNKNQERDEDAINAELFGNDQKRYEDLSCGSYSKQLDVEPHGYSNISGNVNGNISGKVNPNKLIKHTLKSDNSKSIYLPWGYTYRAGKLMNIALESENLGEFDNRVSLWPSLKEVYIPKKVREFMKFVSTPIEGKMLGDDFKLFDQAYLETCLHMANDDLVGKSGQERLEAIKENQSLKKILESIK